MKRAVVLLSGGMDSSVCLAIAKNSSDEVYAITFSYGQRNSFEISAAQKVAEKIGVKEHVIFNLKLDDIGGSALTDRSIEVPKGEVPGSDIPVTYVPARNLIFLSIASAFTEKIGGGTIYIGANVIDYSGYPDCRREFLESFEHTAGLATRPETEISIAAPLQSMTKKEIADLGRKLGIDFGWTTSCYDPFPDGTECGRCESCLLKIRGLEK